MPSADGTVVPLEIATGNVLPLLHEIRHALKAWLDSGTESCIDLRRLPMAPGEEQQIMDRLGQGEVQVQLNALGPSEMQETRYPGVWLVTHYNAEQEILGRFIEITAMPAIALAQRQDVVDGLVRLQDDLAAADA